MKVHKHHSGYYMVEHPDGRRQYLHRYIWEQAYGPIPAGHFVDHIDRDTTNNSLDNLRLVTPAQSARNIRGRSRLGKGISWKASRQRYRVQVRRGDITVDRLFRRLEDAQAFAREVRDSLHGEYACHDTL